MPFIVRGPRYFMFKETWEKHNSMKQEGGIVNDGDDDDDCRAMI